MINYNKIKVFKADLAVGRLRWMKDVEGRKYRGNVDHGKQIRSGLPGGPGHHGDTEAGRAAGTEGTGKTTGARAAMARLSGILTTAAGGRQPEAGASAMRAAGGLGADRGQQTAGQGQNRAENEEQDQQASSGGSHENILPN